MQPTYRVVVAEPDGREGADEIVAPVHAIRDAGGEVIHLGALHDARHVAEVVLQEDADAVGVVVSGSSGQELVSDLVSALESRDLGELPLFVVDLTRDAPGASGVPGVATFGARGCHEDLVAWLVTATMGGDGLIVG